MRSRLRAVAALLVLVGVLVGLPIAFLRGLGAPWTGWPGAGELRRQVEAGELSTALLGRSLVALTWLTWTRFVLSVALDVAARAHGSRVPLVGLLGPSHRLASTLVSAVLMLLPGVRAAGATTTPTDAQPSDSILTWLVDDRTSASALDPTAAVTETGNHQEWVVQRHESWWSIAEEALGDGTRWRELVAANTGRQVAPGTYFDGSPDALAAGWTLAVPDASPAVERAALEVEVRPGDTLVGIAAAHPEHVGSWHEVWELNAGRSFGERTFDDPDVILPGWHLTIAAPSNSDTGPTSAAPSSVADAAPPHTELDEHRKPPVPAASSDQDTRATNAASVTLADAPISSMPTQPSQDVPSWTAAEGSFPAPVGIGGAVVLSAGVVGVVRVRRQRELRRATVRSRLPAHNDRAGQTELTLRRLERSDLLVRIDLAMRSAAAGLLRTQARPLGALVAADGRVELLLTGTAQRAPAPWEPNSHGDRWTLPAAVTLDDVAKTARSTPLTSRALCQLGEVGGELLLVDLEAIGLLAVDGRTRATRGSRASRRPARRWTGRRLGSRRRRARQHNRSDAGRCDDVRPARPPRWRGVGTRDRALR